MYAASGFYMISILLSATLFLFWNTDIEASRVRREFWLEEHLAKPLPTGGVLTADKPALIKKRFLLVYEGCERGDLQMVLDGIEEGAIIGLMRTPSGESELHIVCKNGHTNVFQFLIQQIPESIDKKNNAEESILHSACLSDNQTIVEELLSILPVNAPDRNGYTPFHTACQRGSIDTVAYLLENRVPHTIDINLPNKTGDTPLHTACLRRRPTIASLLLEANEVDINQRNHSRETALHCACRRGWTDIIKLLLDHKADMHARDEHNHTPLHLACLHGHTKAAKMLIRHGARLDEMSKEGISPLDCLKLYWVGVNPITPSPHQASEFLIQHGIDIRYKLIEIHEVLKKLILTQEHYQQEIAEPLHE